ncbi:MAG: neutral/alkaline non-lysosomal ceramidase N-terminal domain-containing protein, partial [Opitutaceae bacterium]|nr:neutral/alkaline non-lysosomal ceramidase N-terminal domain-containing protein [Opitutaceae bacterium]
MKIGFGKSDITPRVGVQLAGFGPFRNRHSNGVRDNLWARAIAFEQNGEKVIIVSCDLTGIVLDTTEDVRAMVSNQTGIDPGAIMLACTHTHSAPSTGTYIGWGEADVPYMETLPARIAQACVDAFNHLDEAELSHAEVPCEGIAVNREYDQPFNHGKPIEHFLTDEWRPDKPDLTETTCHVLKATRDGEIIWFISYFACHPVVCCEETFKIHGDFPGVATNKLEAKYPGSIGLFLQGSLGDVNSCVAHYPEEASMRALEILSDRFAAAVQNGIEKA